MYVFWDYIGDSIENVRALNLQKEHLFVQQDIDIDILAEVE